jgi:hypothetical protein
MIREEWKSLNGIWSYRNASAGEIEGDIPSGDLGKGVMVPSCLESGLSGKCEYTSSKRKADWRERADGFLGIMAEDPVVYSWFQTTFTIPQGWNDQDIIINFGAVDYEATVFLNVRPPRISYLYLN